MFGDGDTERAVEPLETTPGLPVRTDAARENDASTDPGGVAADDEPGGTFPTDEPSGWTDILTGCDGPRYWDRVVTSEQARNARHHRTATIALVEFAGIDAVARRWGSDLALGLFIRLARVLASGIRSSDHIARVGRTRFAVLLVETDEILAINFVDRVRARCEADVDPVANGLRMAIGWASPAPGGHLADAQRVAAERLHRDLASRA
jgi:diguanylate cyclase (GGDEF)-like protein